MIRGYYEPSSRKFIEEKALNELEELKVKCQCGHTLILPVYLDSGICNHCGNKVKNNTKLYFKYKLRKEIKKNGN